MPASKNDVQNWARYESEQIVPPLVKGLLRKTRPVYSLPKGKSEKALFALGSCFFLHVWGKTFLVTASHVARETADNDLFIPIATDVEAVEGEFHYTGDWKHPPEEDRIDLAFLELPERISSRLPSGSFFTASEWDENDKIVPTSVYLVCGWPGKRNDPNPRGGVLPRSPIAYRDYSLLPRDYAKYGIASGTHYAIRFDRKRALDDNHLLVVPPRLKGISGSPLMRFHKYGSRDDLLAVREPKLVGVCIEVENGAIIATRLAFLLKAIFERYKV
jgi:hypothetical protein